MDDKTASYITSSMTVLDIVSRHRESEAVFKRWDHEAGICICCHALFETLQDLADRYALDLDRLVAELHRAAERGAVPSTG